MLRAPHAAAAHRRPTRSAPRPATAATREGRPTREIVFSWRNTASNGEKVWWDTEITDGAGVVVGGRAGSGRPSSTHQEVLYDALLVGSRTTRCFPIRADSSQEPEGACRRHGHRRYAPGARRPWAIRVPGSGSAPGRRKDGRLRLRSRGREAIGAILALDEAGARNGRCAPSSRILSVARRSSRR